MMGKGRMEAFSDGVIAILITIMVLELKVPHGETLADLMKLAPVFFSYILSFVYLAIYWNNHHHMLHTVRRVTGPILWANMHLLFWLSLVPFVTSWKNEHSLRPMPEAAYGVVLLMSAISYTILQTIIVRSEGENSVLAKAIGDDYKGKASVVLYLIAIAAAFYQPLVSGGLYLAVAIIWFIPDRRIERQLGND